MNADQVKNHIMELEVRGDRFIYVTELPSLREIASYRIARAIRFHNSPPEIYNSEKYINLKNYDDDVESLTASPEILDLIKNCLKKIEEEFNLWVHHFSRVLFCQSRRPYKLFRLYSNWCVWLQNGQIDYFKTGMKILRSGQLNEVQKFIISCEYCLENEIKKVSLDALPTDFIANTNYYDDGILFYWIHFLKNALREVPVENHRSAETAMVRNFQRHSRFAIEFFWPRLNEDDQFIVVSEWISSRCRNHFECSVLERLISSLSWNQQRCLLEQKWQEILINLSLHSRSTRCAFWAWKYYRDTLSEEKFCWIMEKIFREWQDNRNSCPMLSIIWETADDHRRNFTALALSNMIIDMCLFRDERAAVGFEFLNKFLPLISTDKRQELIYQKLFKIRTQFVDLSRLDEILDLCFPHPNDMWVFLKSLNSIRFKIHFSLKFAQKGDFKTLNMLVEYIYGRDFELARLFKETLLESMFCDIDRFVHFICDIEKWHELANFIEEIFPNRPVLILDNKQMFVELAFVSDAFKLRFHKRLSIYETVEIIQMIFKDEELECIKFSFFRVFEESLKTKSYWENEEISDEAYFEQIVTWCLGDKATVIWYSKKHEWPDIIFDRIIYRIGELYRESRTWSIYVETLLTRLNKYLKWCLPSDYQVKTFKLSKFFMDFEQTEIFRLISIRKDSETLRILKDWFCLGHKVLRKLEIEKSPTLME